MKIVTTYMYEQE